MTANLDALFEPASIAVVGLSRDATSYSRRLLGFLQRFEYPGSLFGVNPSLTEVDGVACFPALADVGQPVDLVLVFTPAARVTSVMAEAADVGARVAIVFSSGFAEVGAEGREVQQAIGRIAASAGMRVLGPNCQGVMHVPRRTVASFSNAAAALDPAQVGPVAFVGQSGAVGGAVFDLLRERGLTPAVWVSTGNQVDVDVTEVASHLLHDPAVDTILVYVEQTPDGSAWDALSRAARAAGKQLVALHGGATQAGRRAVTSHTGALVGERRAFELMSEANGVLLVDDLEPMIDLALARHGGAHRSGRRLAIISTSGGAGSLAADWCERSGLEMQRLSEATRAAVEQLLPAVASSVNPIDVTAAFMMGSTARMGELCTVVSNDRNVDHTLLVLTNTVGAVALEVARSVVSVRARMGSPLSIAYLASADRTGDARRIMTDDGIPIFRSVGAALRAVGALALPADPVERAPAEARPEPPLTVLTEAEGRALLDEVGVACPASILVASGEDAARAASELGGTVVLKVQSADLLHKTDIGGVQLDVRPGDAGAAYDSIVNRVRRAAPTAVIDGVLVQEQVSTGVELLVGVQGARDGYPAVLTVGIGGTAVEIYGDIATALAPVDAHQAIELLRSLRGWPLLQGFRGSTPADVDAAALAIARISGLGDRYGKALVDLEVNPLIVHASGTLAVDFVCRLDRRFTAP